jgi:hypothetical protein
MLAEISPAMPNQRLMMEVIFNLFGFVLDKQDVCS